MKRNRSRRKPRPDQSCCDSPGADDGVDPRQYFKPHASTKPHRKTLQLCGQVRRVLDYVLSGECDDDLLRGLIVQEVRPAPDASRLLVTVTPLDASRPTSAEQILARLAAISPQLRYEVSQSIHRRKTPQLMFEVALQPLRTDAPDPDQGDRHDAD